MAPARPKLAYPVSTAALTLAALLAFGAVPASQAQAQSNGLQFLSRDPPAPLAGAMTEAQARRACRVQMRGGRDSRAGRARKMEICMRQNMNGK